MIFFRIEGEADTVRSNYNCTFPAMISDWRSKFLTGTKQQTDPFFPFGFVQLGPNNPPTPGILTAGYPTIRWQQTANYGYVPNSRMPNTFMGIAVDLTDFKSPSGPYVKLYVVSEDSCHPNHYLLRVNNFSRTNMIVCRTNISTY